MIVASSKLADEPAAGAVDGWFDAPSGLPGAAFWDAILATEAARWVRYERPATIVLAEIVGLDLVGRAWGRDVAVRSAEEVGRTLRSGCRASDYVARLDGRRFAVLLTETDEIAAINMVERVRISCERLLGRTGGAARIPFGRPRPTRAGPPPATAPSARGRPVENRCIGQRLAAPELDIAAIARAQEPCRPSRLRAPGPCVATIRSPPMMARFFITCTV